MNKGSKPELPEEFLNGPWITAQEMMDWFRITKPCLKTWRYRGIVAYSIMGGVTMYNRPWIVWRLSKNWKWKRPEE